jgi:hypothetical protein
MCRGKFFVGRLGAVFAGVVRRVAGAAQRVGEIRCLALLDPLLETPQRRPLPHVRGRRRLRRAGSPPDAAARSQGLNGQTNVLQLANWVLALSPMNSVADQMAPVGSANEAL